MKNNNNKRLPIVGISCGDLNGIGPEVILKTFEDNRMLELCTPVVFANARLMNFIKKQLKINLSIHGIDKLEDVEEGKFNVFNLWREGVNIEWGVLDETVGTYAIKSFRAAVEALKTKSIHTLVTAPIHKYNIQSEEFTFAGHTGYLNEVLEGDALMLMLSDQLRMGLITEHLPIKEVSQHITKELVINKIKNLYQTLVQDFTIEKPKIAVLGLNPHSGDHGVIGNEEQEILIPAIKALYDEGFLVFGPYAADGFFGNKTEKQFDAVVSCYHDQGLVPFKMLSFGNGVNFTSGLSFIRTSPDHGTAFDIAGKGMADASSFREAVFTSIDLYNNRRMYKKYSKNPLPIKN